jgi:hypothetical protein
MPPYDPGVDAPEILIRGFFGHDKGHTPEKVNVHTALLSLFLTGELSGNFSFRRLYDSPRPEFPRPGTGSRV